MSAYDVEEDERNLLRELRGAAARNAVRAAATRLEAGEALAAEDRHLLAAIAREFARRMPERKPGRPGLRRNVAPVDIYVARNVRGMPWAEIHSEFGIGERLGRKMIATLTASPVAKKKSGRNS